MKSNWLLIREKGRYSIVRDDERSEIAARSDTESFVKAIHERLTELGYAGEPILLAISAWDCLAADLPEVDARMARERKSLSFALEREIPMASEDFVADYCKRKGAAFSIAIEIDDFAEILDALTELGVLITSIAPETMLVVQRLVAEDKTPPTCIMLFERPDWLELIRLEEKRPTAWRICDKGTLDLEIGSLVGDLTDVALLAAGKEYRGSAHRFEAIDVEPTRASLQLMANAITSGRLAPWFELRRDQLAGRDRFFSIRKQIRIATICSGILVASLIGYLLSGIAHFESQLDRFESEQRSCFTEVLPDSRVPVSVRPRLESELKSRQGLSGGSEMPDLDSAVALLNSTVASFPEDLRFRVLQIRIDEASLDLDGQALSHSDSETIARQLRDTGLEVDPPRSENMSDGGVSFSIHATKPEEK